jgi:hypothetical protein
VRERFGGEVGGTPRAGGGVRYPACPSMREDAILHRVDARRFRLWERDGGVASGGDAQAVGGSRRGVFCKITTIQTRDTDALYVP